MKFRTEINLGKTNNPIKHSDAIITIGSCFAENIGRKLDYHKFNVMKNPFGVLYNPVSVKNALRIVKDKKEFTKNDLFRDKEEWHSFYHHSDFSHHEEQICLNNINDTNKNVFEFLGKANAAMITFGTSFIYRFKGTGEIVSNCHKIPAKEFEREMLTVELIKNEIQEIISILKSFNKNIKIIFTVSPVRHWKDGAVDNQLSKSKLLLAVSESLDEKIEYFPGYEIMMDDLRDYRFYDSDLLHPNSEAVNYIWEKFSDCYFDEKDKTSINEAAKIVDAFNHRPRNIYSEAHQNFLSSNLKKIDDLISKYPFLDFSTERKYFSDLLK